MDENADVPFPDEDTLKIPVPGEWIQAISVVTDLGAASDSAAAAWRRPSGPHPPERSSRRPCEAQKRVPLYRLSFPDGVRPLVVPSAFVPDKLLEYAVFKLTAIPAQGRQQGLHVQQAGQRLPGQGRPAQGRHERRAHEAPRGGQGHSQLGLGFHLPVLGLFRQRGEEGPRQEEGQDSRGLVLPSIGDTRRVLS